MSWWNPFSWFGTSKSDKIVLTEEQRISKAKPLEKARDYVEAAINEVEKLKKNQDIWGFPLNSVQNKILRYLTDAHTIVRQANEQNLDRMLDDCSQTLRAPSYTRPLTVLGGGSFGSHPIKVEDILVNAAGILEVIKQRLREL